MKDQRLNAIREVLSSSLVTSQDELRRKLRRRGIEVTQATLSRDIHELQLLKGPEGYSLPNGHRGTTPAGVDDAPPSLKEMIDSFGLRVRQAMNQVVIVTAMGGAQPVAAAHGPRGMAGGRWHARRRRYGAGDLPRSTAGRRKLSGRIRKMLES